MMLSIWSMHACIWTSLYISECAFDSSQQEAYHRVVALLWGFGHQCPISSIQHGASARVLDPTTRWSTFNRGCRVMHLCWASCSFASRPWQGFYHVELLMLSTSLTYHFPTWVTARVHGSTSLTHSQMHAVVESYTSVVPPVDFSSPKLKPHCSIANNVGSTAMQRASQVDLYP